MSLHYVNPEPFDPAEADQLTPEQERFYTASQWQLMWWKFRRHRLAVIAAWFLAVHLRLDPDLGMDRAL